MKNYTLRPDESVLFEGTLRSTNLSTSTDVVLTNVRIMLITTTKKLFAKDQITSEEYAISDIKIYNDIPQIKQKDGKVEIFFTGREVTLPFLSSFDTRKFVNAAMELLTGKNAAARGADKFKGAVQFVDDTLGINALNAVKNVFEKGVVGSVLGGFGKKESASQQSDIASEAMGLAREVVEAKIIHKDQPSQPAVTPQENIEMLKKLKELLDVGIITQEEFDAKKKQILDL